MAEVSKVTAKTRNDKGSAAARRLRNEGILPGVLCNEKGEAREISIDGHSFGLMLRDHASENLIIDISVDDDKQRKALLKDVQHDPLTDEMLHVDFVEISMTKKMRTHIALTLNGEPEGVTKQGGILEHTLREIEVECLPGDLVEEIEADISGLKIGDALRVGDLEVAPEIDVLTEEDMAIATVSMPREEEEEEPEAEGEEGEEAEGAESGEDA